MENIIRFADWLDEIHPGQPGNTPDTPSVKLLSRLLNDDEAKIVMMCEPYYLSVEEIAEKGSVSAESIEGVLEKLAQKGLIMCNGMSGIVRYRRCPWVPGVLEYVILDPNIDEETLECASKFFEEYNKKNDAFLMPNMTPALGGMRTIPVHEAVESKSQILPYETVKNFLDHATKFAIGNCACRTAARALGRGCEHTHIDTCIALDDYADYNIRTGRCREITYEEAVQRLGELEKEGLVHQVFNTTGPESTCFICNCCGCSCTVLRSENLMNLQEASRSNFVAEVDPDKCVGCGACVEACNTNALALGSSFCKGYKPENNLPDHMETDWTEEYWDKDFLKRKMVNSYGTAPCKTACPAHISVQGYIRKAHEGKFDEALKVIKRDNPFPAICGRVCTRRCEEECTRGTLDETIAIDDIKKYIADKELSAEHRFIPEIPEKREQKIAVIGAGPAGLTCAYYSAVNGFDVTVYEKEDRVGGMMTMGIPSFRLDKDVVDAEISVLKELGVKFVTGVEVGKDVSISQLREQGFGAFYVSIGLQEGGKLGLPGENAENVITGIEFMRNVNLNQKVKLDGKAIVVGGGNVAADVARAAVRCGADKVDMVCLESLEEMPCNADDRIEVTGEGITIHPGWGPVEIFNAEGKVTGIKFKKCLSVYNENGAFKPEYDENDTMVFDADYVLYCVGQKAVWGNLLDGSKVELRKNKIAVADGLTYQTAEPDIFVGGDIVTGPKLVIDAIAGGKSGATSIRRFLLGQNLSIRREREYHALEKENLELEGFDRLPRQRIAAVDPEKAQRTFKDLRTTLTDEQLQKESCRCLGCGISVVDESKCLGCGICTTRCEFDAIKLKKVYDDVPADDTDSFVAKLTGNLRTRMANIAAKGKLEDSVHMVGINAARTGQVEEDTNA